MTNHPSRRQFLKSSTTLAAGAALASTVPQMALAVPTTSDWIDLFDGKSLAGWHKNPQKIGHGTGGIWRVEEGAITGEQDPPGSGNGGILLTDRKFGDFELLIDMKPDWGVCSGLFLRGNDVGQCLQMMVDYHDAGNVGHLYGEGTGGFNTRAFDIDGLYDADKELAGFKTTKQKSAADVGLIRSCNPEQWIKAWKVNDWNTARVIVRGKYPLVTTWINGQEICHFDGATSTAERYDKKLVQQTLSGQGRIAVQVHGGKGWPNGAKCSWRNIKIRVL